MTSRYVPLLTIAAVAAVAACSEVQDAPVTVENVVVTAPAPGMPMAAAYLDIDNRSGVSIEITGVTSPEYESVEMHETTLENGVSRMRKIERLTIADGETAKLERGGKHLMLMQPVGKPEHVTLNFYSDDVLLLSVTTQFVSATPSAHGRD